MNNEKKGKLKAGSLGPLLPIALAELLISKGIVTKDELNKAMTKTLLGIYSKQRKLRSSRGEKGR